MKALSASPSPPGGTLSLLYFLGSIALDVRATYRVTKKGILPDSVRSPPSEEDAAG